MDGRLRRKRRYIFWSRITGIAVVLFPLSFHSVDFRASFTQGISVSANKASPAYAAFEDLREDYKHSGEFKFPAGAKMLTAGTEFDFKAAKQKIVTVRQIAMRGVTIRAPTEPAAVPTTVAAQNQSQEAVFFAEGRIQRREIARGPAELTDLSGSLLPLNQRKQNLAQELLQEDWSAPTPAARAQELVQEELQRTVSETRSIPTRGGSTIVIRKPDASPSRARLPDVAVVEPPRDEPMPMFNVASALGRRTSDPANLRPLWLTGQIEMTEGLAWVGPETHMVVKRVFNGYVFEKGRIWVSEGRFEIRVKEATGYLVAELVTRTGQVLGRGEINLLDLHQVPGREDRVANLRIPLRPTNEGATFRAVSGYSHGAHKMTVAGAKVEIQSHAQPMKANDDGYAVDPVIDRDSSFVARAVADGHWPSLVVGQAKEPQDIRVFSNKLVQALISLNMEGASRAEKKDAGNQAIVWGRLVSEGKPAAGAQIEMAGDYKPIYFNELYVPDSRLKGTSANGLFAFIKVRYGVQALRVRAGGKTYPAQVFPTENKHVTYVELDIRSKAVAQFKVFNAFEMQRPVAARIRLVGAEETLDVGKDEIVQYAVAANPFMVEAEAGGEYEVSRVTVSGTPHVVHVPLVQRQWLYQLMQDRRVSQISQRGIIVGLIDDAGYQVDLTGYPMNENMQIVYLDHLGRPTDSKVGLQGGGFAIFNAPAGLQTLFLRAPGTHHVFSQVVVAEPEFVTVITH